MWTLGAVGRRRRWQRGLRAMKPDPAAVVRVRRAARRGFAGRLIRFQPRCWLPARPRCAAVRRGAAPHNGVRQLEGESHPQAAPRCDPPLRLCGGADPVHRQAKALPPRPRQALLRPRRCRRPRPGRRGGGAPRCGLSGAGQGRAAGRGGAARALFSAHTLCAAPCWSWNLSAGEFPPGTKQGVACPLLAAVSLPVSLLRGGGRGGLSA